MPAISCCAGRTERCGPGRCRTHAPDFLAVSPAGSQIFPASSSPSGAALRDGTRRASAAVYQPFILAMQPITLLVIYLMRPSSSTLTQLDWKTIAFIPAALLGAWFGWCIFKRLSDRQFEVAVNVLLILSGIGLIF